jgi:carbamoyltransferase
MRYCGFSEFFHDAGIAFITSEGDISFASQAERYSKYKNDPELPDVLMNMIKKDDHVSFYEDHGHRTGISNEWNCYNPSIPASIVCDIHVNHHVSHAALGYYTRPWTSKDDTVILTVDGAGEYQCMGIYDSNFNLLEKEMTPRSVGYFYTFTTRYLKLRTLEDEYVVMGLSAYGNPIVGEQMYNEFNAIPESDDHSQDRAIVSGILNRIYKGLSKEDIAASVQYLAEKKIMEYAHRARKYGSKLVLSGGCAQNVVINSMIKPLFDDMWIPTAPTDAGSSLGCAAYSYGKATGNDRINWTDPYLGYNINRDINPKAVVDHLLEHTYCGIANGRAEFGPRALGNRSLIADVRFDVKDTVNAIKRRQEYRPFAPAILEEFADQYFEGPMSEYMQYTAKALHDYKSVTHIDGTARVQIVRKDCKSVFRKVIEEYYERTGVPMLLNTSLNIRGKPMVNDEKDAAAFEKHYNVKVF